VLLQRRGLFRAALPRPALALASAAAVAIVYFTYDLNHGPFRLIQAVVILAAGHGHPLWFPLTAVAGTLALLLLARSVPSTRAMRFLGRNGLVLFCLNGLVYHHVNGPVAAWFVRAFPSDGWSVAVFSAAVTVASVAAVAPLVWALDRWLPQLVGRPSAVGPLLPAILAPARGPKG
jgi:acyltransferase